MHRARARRRVQGELSPRLAAADMAEARASGPQTEAAPSTRKRSAERAPDREREHPVAVSPTGIVSAVRPIVTV